MFFKKLIFSLIHLQVLEHLEKEKYLDHEELEDCLKYC